MKNHLIATQLEVDTIPSTDQHMSSVAIACQKYKESLEKEKDLNKKKDLNNENKKLINEIGVVIQKYERLHKLYENLDAKFVFSRKIAEEKRDMS